MLLEKLIPPGCGCGRQVIANNESTLEDEYEFFHSISYSLRESIEMYVDSVPLEKINSFRFFFEKRNSFELLRNILFS